MAVHKKVDIVTIGAGWTAGVLAWKLGSAGHKLVSIEQGEPRWANPNFTGHDLHDPLRHELRQALMVDLARETWTWRPNAKVPSLPIRQYGSFHPGQGLGGSSVHWTAQFWRFLPADFQHRRHNIERYGKDKIPPGMTVQDWPVTYEELEPYYAAVETDIGASGQAGNIKGKTIAGGNPFEAPRSGPYPLPAHPMSLAAQQFEQACTELGYHPFPQPAGILSRAHQGPLGDIRSGCIYCGYCTRYGCEVDAKTSGVNVHIPAGLKTGNWEIRTGCKVLGVNLADNGLATGITYVDQTTGEVHQQPADLVVLTAYTLTNVRMMLLSTNNAHPHGIGNDRGMVGKNYTYQITKSPVDVAFEGQRFNQFMGNGVIQSLIYDFNADDFDHSKLDFIGGASIFAGSGQRDPLTSTLSLLAISQGGVTQQPKTPTPVQPTIASEVASVAGKGVQWGQAWKENLRQHWDSVFSIGIQGEVQAYEDNFLDLDPVYKDAWGVPLLRLTFDWHDNELNMYKHHAQVCKQIAQQMKPTWMNVTATMDPYDIHTYQSTHCTGGAIMGSDPAKSVTTTYGQVWDTPNVFVTGAALYPQNPGANPTETLLALAYRTGDAIRDTYFKHPNQLIE